MKKEHNENEYDTIAAPKPTGNILRRVFGVAFALMLLLAAVLVIAPAALATPGQNESGSSSSVVTSSASTAGEEVDSQTGSALSQSEVALNSSAAASSDTTSEDADLGNERSPALPAALVDTSEMTVPAQYVKKVPSSVVLSLSSEEQALGYLHQIGRAHV